jgi:neopullulanase
VKFERGELKALFNIGERPAFFVANELIFNNLVNGSTVSQYGFVIYK